ncbi:MAG TPA: Gfo/Idh/MocA family oxidoreductase [Meiothermus sp.]|jgi:predicted dehydrogenase|nr:Gfo/Idh/MocA family oxidoreductase [Meiothermus sp.]
MEKMGFGILGAARIAASALIPAIYQSANARLVAVAARDGNRAAEYAAQHGIPKAYGYQELLADPEVEAVYNPLPNSLHLPWTLRALEAGKHVLCEKPLALNAAEAEQMDQAAKRANRTLMEAFMYRFHPQIARALELVRSGSLGELRLIRPSFSFALERSADIRWVAALGGGALYDVGCYCVTLSRLFAGREPLAVTGWSDLTPPDHPGGGGADHSFVGVLDFGEGLRAVFDCSFAQPFRQRVELVGDRGTLVIPEAWVPGRRGSGGPTRHGLDAPHLVVNGQEEAQPAADQYQLMVEHFVRAARGQEPLRYPAEEAVRQMRVLDALYASARAGRTVRLG